MNLVLFLVRVNLLAIVDLDSQIERLILYLLTLDVALAGR